jgi:GrpB-like predicted nucleotidyltransferase (UPF0157 family)
LGGAQAYFRENTGRTEIGMGRQVQVVAHDPSWQERFREEANQLYATLGQEVIAIHHIGSTSIPNIYAKPIIDILIEVQDIDRIDDYNPLMRQMGYLPKGENGLTGRRYFIKGDEEYRTNHVHIYERGHPDIERHLNFRDYLQIHPEDAYRYSMLKEELARRFPTDIDAYQSGKAELIKQLERKANTWKAELRVGKKKK